MSRGTKTVLHWLLACGAVVALLYAGWWSLCEWYFYASIGYEVGAEFAELPRDDDALEAWLLQQPGVLRSLTSVSRPNPSNKVVRVNLGMSRNFNGRPRFPDLEKACAELGYKGQVARFRDTEAPLRR